MVLVKPAHFVLTARRRMAARAGRDPPLKTRLAVDGDDMRWSLLVTVTTIGAGLGTPTNCARAVPMDTNTIATTNIAAHSIRIVVPLPIEAI